MNSGWKLNLLRIAALLAVVGLRVFVYSIRWTAAAGLDLPQTLRGCVMFSGFNSSSSFAFVSQPLAMTRS